MTLVLTPGVAAFQPWDLGEPLHLSFCFYVKAQRGSHGSCGLLSRFIWVKSQPRLALVSAECTRPYTSRPLTSSKGDMPCSRTTWTPCMCSGETPQVSALAFLTFRAGSLFVVRAVQCMQGV